MILLNYNGNIVSDILGFCFSLQLKNQVEK